MKQIASVRYISRLRNLMVFFNYLVIMFFASTNMLISKYVILNNKSHQFLSDLSYIPKNSVRVFFSCLLLYALLAGLILARPVTQISGRKINFSALAAEIVICLIISWQLNMIYSGLYLLVFSDCLFHLRRENNKATSSIMAILVAFYFFSNYYVFSFFFRIADPMAYFNILEGSSRGILIMVKNVMEITNLIFFTGYLSLYISHQVLENENISQELNMINQVNQELKNYAAITERIGENNERKRLAREIHDTLGHALTGIAAGVDACLIIIDKQPEVAKKQLQLVSQVVREGISDVRNSLQKLRPGALEERGLEGAVQRMIEEFTGLSEGLTINFDCRLENVDFEVAKEDALFRVIQESITNSIRHGAASVINISMFIDNDHLKIIVDDNGFGCHSIQPGYGLTQMKERIAAIHGSVQFDGSDGFVTRIQVPLQKGER